MKRLFLLVILALCQAAGVYAQSRELVVATVTRPPFSMLEEGENTGFSIDLWKELASELGVSYRIERLESFQDMLAKVRDGSVDLAIANISITADRETVMDFSQPIFASGLQIMTPRSRGASLETLRGIFSPELLGAIGLAVGLLFVGGMLMWWFERRSQSYFDMPARKALFPSFWWALNLVVNGGFEERVPRTFFGRLLGVFLVVASLFLVSVFVAKITAVLTVDALENNVNSVNDLDSKLVGTIDGSTAAIFLENRDIRFTGYPGLAELVDAFEAGDLQAVVFDAPILAYYVNNANGRAELSGPVFRRENYGIALPTGSQLAEPINQALLRLRENGAYARLMRKWFGSAGSNG